MQPPQHDALTAGSGYSRVIVLTSSSVTSERGGIGVTLTPWEQRDLQVEVDQIARLIAGVISDFDRRLDSVTEQIEQSG